MYFDAVLDKDMRSLFSGTPSEVMMWLDQNYRSLPEDTTVCRGRTLEMTSAAQYVNGGHLEDL